MKPTQTVVSKPYKWGLRKMHKRNQHLFKQLPAPPSHRMCRWLFKRKLERHPNTEKVFINYVCTNTTHDHDFLAWQVAVIGDENRKCGTFQYISGIYQTRIPTCIYCFCGRISIWWLNDIIMYMAFNLPYDVITSFPARCLITVNHAKAFVCCRPFQKKTYNQIYIYIYT